MGKNPAVAAFVGYLGYSLFGAPSALAQQPNEPIRFGQKREQTYEISQLPYSDVEHYRTLIERQGKRWGHAHIVQLGFIEGQLGFNGGLGFVLHGVLADGTEFIYQADRLGYSLHSARNSIQLGFFDSHDTDSFIEVFNARDYATVDGKEVSLGNAEFYEGPRPAPQQGSDLRGKLHDSYSNHTRWLNVSAIRSLTEKPMKTEPAQLEKLLDKFLQ